MASVKKFLDELFAKKPLKKAAETPPPPPPLEGTGDQSYIRREIEKEMKKKKKDEKKATEATREALGAPNAPKKKGY